MLDLQLLRSDIDSVAEKLKARGYTVPVERFLELEQLRKDLQVETQQLQAQRNASSKQIGQLKSKGEDASQVMAAVADLGDRLKDSSAKLQSVQQELNTICSAIPNIPDATVPIGDSEDDNKEIDRWGEPTAFDFEPLDHVDLGEKLGQIDFAVATKITASRFVVMHDQIARLHRAIAQFMLDSHTQEHGYQETYVPYMANSASLFGTGQLPKFIEDQFATSLAVHSASDDQRANENKLYLIPTAEVTLTNLVRDCILEQKDLPIKMVAQTPCFRREAGSYGRDTRGMIRQHQFEKIELVQIVHPDESHQALEELTGHAETILRKLDLPYRKVILCGGDLGFSSAKTYDLEVWLPGQNAYREISSCSNFEAFQARRMKARYRADTQKPQLVHTLNGSGLAVGRTLVAILENYQNSDHSITIPEVLRAYMGEQTIIS